MEKTPKTGSNAHCAATNGTTNTMSEDEQLAAFADELDKMIHRFSSEFDLSYAIVVGVLQMKVHVLCAEAATRKNEL